MLTSTPTPSTTRYIKDKDEDLGSRLNLQPKQVRSALADLMQEGLVMQEEMEDETYSSRLSAYWYIDLRHAVNVIRLRVHQMKLILEKRRQAKEVQQVLRRGSCRGSSRVCHALVREYNLGGALSLVSRLYPSLSSLSLSLFLSWFSALIRRLLLLPSSCAVRMNTSLLRGRVGKIED